ncbi:uncharacterized protein KY384_007035 [Bacidia gigantensis]|uniref:uncharacterized protein n=1 Tax=Bacidia gigantensis TaxID=2732470 RepID=UPI001D05B1D3|nr:uncharacterized protein KY384_007035 [Bacidia gigantensis]KAG8528119.1 hypothetical protein KY384_007035 [Bacidia gigantensis]
MPPNSSPITSLTITNPLILYRTLLATKRIEPDPAQHRLAIHLQKIYNRLKDYKPEIDFRQQLDNIQRLVHKEKSVDNGTSGGNLKWAVQKEASQITALTRSLTARESVLSLQSPRGLLCHGDVGNGKSMLIDLLADCLPNQKRRWHFNTFMLEIFAKLDSRCKCLRSPSLADSRSHEYSLLSLAKDLIIKSPIIFLDEFQIPDRATSKILSNFLTAFFQLGGVMIATSNRLPEELANAAGVEFAPPPRSTLGLLSNAFGFRGRRVERGRSETVFGGKGDFAAFLEVLKARCEVWEMEGSKDWRRRDSEHDTSKVSDIQDEERGSASYGLQEMNIGNLGLGYEQSLRVNPSEKSTGEEQSSETRSALPAFYFVEAAQSPSSNKDTITQTVWDQREATILKRHGLQDHEQPHVSWKSTTLRVYGRDLHVPRQSAGVTKWTFAELCGKSLGPADYISLASTFHTFIMTEVPVLSFLQKNEARRFITLLDALCEARCKLMVAAESGPDAIFFPEAPPTGEHVTQQGEENSTNNSNDGVYPETFSEIYQDQTSPFRPNISLYTSSASEPYYASSSLPTSASQLSKARSILADEDSDFGPVYGADRGQDVSDDLNSTGSHVQGQEQATGPLFSKTDVYTGDDERFAYKRAQSRLWELCGSRWWSREGDWWRPLSKEARHWEDSRAELLKAPHVATIDDSPQIEGESESRLKSSPFRTSEEPPPRFNWTHAWGMMTWGKKAGVWGQGPTGLGKRNQKGPGK